MQSGFRSGFSNKTVWVFDNKGKTLGHLHCVADVSEISADVENDNIGYAEHGQFYWYMEPQLEDAIAELGGTEGYAEAQDIIQQLVRASDDPLIEPKEKQLELFSRRSDTHPLEHF